VSVLERVVEFLPLLHVECGVEDEFEVGDLEQVVLLGHSQQRVHFLLEALFVPEYQLHILEELVHLLHDVVLLGLVLLLLLEEFLADRILRPIDEDALLHGPVGECE